MNRGIVGILIIVVVAMVGPPAAAGDGGLSGVVMNRRGVPLADVRVSVGEYETITESDGRFFFPAAQAGEVVLERVAYAPRAIQWDGESFLLATMAPRLVRAIHVAGWIPVTDSGFQRMLDIGAATAVDALVIDVKDESGRVFHQSAVPAVDEMGAAYSDPFDLVDRVAHAHSQDFYVVARIVTFQDPVAARARPAWAAKDAASGAPLSRNGQYFLDPHDPGARQYALDLATEICELGVDEVQFDYVRFPDGGLESVDFDGPADAAARQATITGFLTEARARLQPLGCATAADIFGWITNTPTEGGIGQQLEAVSGAVDVVSPMIYPSHYSSGWYGFSTPNDHPGPVVRNASLDALRRMKTSQAVLRPWLQDFYYNASQVREQIVTVDELDLGWMLWNVLSDFTVPGIPTSAELHADESVPDAVMGGAPASTFYDVPDSHVFTDEIAWMAREGITSGCNPPWNDFYCPEQAVSRGQMAAFLRRALDLESGGSGDPFWDDDGSVFEDDIEALAAAGVTRGCNPPDNTRFCPGEPVSRGQMAAFLRRALGSGTP